MTFLTLRNGPTLPMPVVLLALELEERGYGFALSGEQLRLLPPKDKPNEVLTPADRERIRVMKSHLLALVAYVPPAPIWEMAEPSVAGALHRDALAVSMV
jgi:hypothetical protein